MTTSTDDTDYEEPDGWPRWFLIALLYADGQLVKDIALQLDIGTGTVKDYTKIAKANLMGVSGYKANGTPIGIGTKLDMRAALVADGHLTE